LFGDGSHILYVNGQYRGNDDIGRLMHDFSCTDPDEMNYEELAGRARYFKQNEGGENAMGCSIEDLLREGAEQGAERKAKQTAENLVKLGKNTLEEIADATGLPLETVKELEKQTMQLI
jgi:hypothetical protein